MKFKFLIIGIFIAFLTFSSCSSEQPQENSNEDVVSDENSVQENNNQEEASEEESKEEVKVFKKPEEFNEGLTDYEDRWRIYLQDQSPDVTIYHFKTNLQSCEGCYTLYYKKDNTIVKMRIANEVLQQQTNIKDDLDTEIDNDEVCNLFSGTWNECPVICETDEEACATQCGIPVCEFVERAELIGPGEACGKDIGECVYGYSCLFRNSGDEVGVCEKSLRS